MTQNVLYLNIGSGAAKLPGFVNIDIGRGADMRRDVTRGLPFSDATVDAIYSEHFIEHLTQPQIISFLRECRRVLKPGGRLRIATPDLDAIVQQYCDNGWRQPWLDKYGYEWIQSRAEFININFREWGHKWLLNEEELLRLAKWGGLDDALRCQLGESADPLLCGLETRPESTLIIEFQKHAAVTPETPLVSIIIPAFRSEFFCYCLESALVQTYSNIEVLVLDDSPNGIIEEITANYSINDARVSYRRNAPALGEPGNLSQGIRLARGTFIKPLYDDDVLEADAVARLVSAFNAYPGARMAACYKSLINEDGKKLRRSLLYGPLSMKSEFVQGSLVIGEMLSSGINLLGEPTCMLFRRSDALKIEETNVMSLFGRTCFGVGDVCLAMHLLAGGELAYVADPLAQIRIHAGQTQRQYGARSDAMSNWAFLRRQGRRLGFQVSKWSLVVDKVVRKFSKGVFLLRAKRFTFLVARRLRLGLG